MGKGEPVAVVVTEQRVGELIAEAIKGLVPESRVIELIAKDRLELLASVKEGLDSLATKEEVARDLGKVLENLKHFITREELDDTLADLPAPSKTMLTGLEPLYLPDEEQREPIPVKYLEGLNFHSSKQMKGEAGKTNVQTERRLTPADVLTWKDNGETVSFVTADGQKYTVDKE